MNNLELDLGEDVRPMTPGQWTLGLDPASRGSCPLTWARASLAWSHLWLRVVEMHFRSGSLCFELGPRLYLEGVDKLATGNLKLETCFLMHHRTFECFIDLANGIKFPKTTSPVAFVSDCLRMCHRCVVLLSPLLIFFVSGTFLCMFCEKSCELSFLI